ncbi:putative calcium-independent protein kinase c protein [Eutypa lata UCREL1]|uniref:Protein kinase C-like n=1 Tax=Eutypa lata (strain UCR-EL1) TaxID=1287681 RepID=M7SY77_EUTLA|nr:putative calcium-independent protein kinase c protein [Eutypa lata UCREL1]
MNEDEAMANIYRKIEREKVLLNGANAMRQQTNNDAVRSRLDSQMREARRNIQFFEEKLRELQMKRMGQGMEDLIKYDTPYLGPRIQLMLSQIQFKLNVEEQYLKGIEKMVQLYGMEGDRKSKADAAARRIESKQKIQLLKQALKRYEELHIDDLESADSPDDDSINMPNLRKPLTGQLAIRVVQVRDVDHASTGRFSRGPETFVAVKVEDNIVARTRVSRNDKWEGEYHNIEVDKANEIELTVYDKPDTHALPIAMLWVRISDIVEEMRRKRIEAETSNSGWVSADRMGGHGSAPPPQFPMSPQQQQFGGPPNSPGFSDQPQQFPPQSAAPQITSQPIDAWFNLEPTGSIHLSLNFMKQNKDRRPVDLGLGRKGAIRQRKEEVHEMYGHKFVQHQFYNIMRCAFVASQEATDAAKAMYASQTSPSRPVYPDRASSTTTSAAAAAATAAMSGSMSSTSSRPGSIPDYASGRTNSYGGSTMDGREDPYAAGQGYGVPSQPKYNPAAYANVNNYPSQPAVLQHQPHPATQQYQQPAPAQIQQPMYPPTAAVPKPSAPLETPSPVSSSGVPVPSRKPLPLATDPGTGQRIGLDHFNFLAVLGKGNFGKVMLAETKKGRKLYAIKVLKKEFIIENDEVESIRSEKRVFLIANRERHPFLTNLHACFQTETRVYFVMEYISGGDLMLHIQRGQFGTKRAQFYAAEVCLALKYFHENGVIYRDLKLDNILLTLDGHIKIADYGLCKEDMWYGSTTSTFCGTPEFMAPEILLDKKYGRAVDWWAFGVLIYQMLLQQSPFRGEDEDEIYDAILADEPLYPIHMPRDSVSILQKLLTREPDQRLGSGPTDAQEVMNQPFFRNTVWDDIYHKRVAPPFMPTIKNATDTSNFDSEFTSVTPVLTPVQSVLSQAMQEEFRGFSYTADFD